MNIDNLVLSFSVGSSLTDSEKHVECHAALHEGNSYVELDLHPQCCGGNTYLDPSDEGQRAIAHAMLDAWLDKIEALPVA